MLTTFTATLSPMLVMLCCIVIGYVMSRAHLVPVNAATVLSKLENYVIVPALLINTFSTYCTVASIREQYRLILYCLLALAFALVIAIPLSYAFAGKDSYQRNVYRYALTFGNFGFMGNAIVPAILGAEALYSYLLYILPLQVAVYTWGILILIPRTSGESRGIRSILKRCANPVFVSILLGMFLGLSGASTHLPLFVTDTIGKLAACMGPLAMMLTGMVVAAYPIRFLLNKPRVYVASALRLFILPALIISVLYLVGADRDTLFLTLFAFATPLGLNTVVFPSAYGGDASTGASMAMISHTVCVVTIPLMYTLLDFLL